MTSANPLPADDAQALLDQIADDVTDRFQRGEKPRLDEYVHRYPQLVAELERIFQTIVQLQATLDPLAE